MALIIPDLFTPYLTGRRQAIADNWTDLSNYNTVQKGQIDNLKALGTLSADINKAYESTDYWALRNLSNQYQLDMLARTYPYLVQNNIRNLNAAPQFSSQFNPNRAGGANSPRPNLPPDPRTQPLTTPGSQPSTGAGVEQTLPQENPELTLAERLAALNLLPVGGGQPFAMDQIAINELVLGAKPRDLSGLARTADLLDQVPVYDTRTTPVLRGRGLMENVPLSIQDESYVPISRDSLYERFSPDILNTLTPGQLYITEAGDNGYTGLYTDAQGHVFQLTFDKNNVITGRTPVDMTVSTTVQGGL